MIGTKSVRWAQGDRFADGVLLPADLRSPSQRAVTRILDRERAHRFSLGLGIQKKRNEFLANYNTQRDNWYYDTVTFGAGAAFATTLLFQQQQTGTKLLNQ